MKSKVGSIGKQEEQKSFVDYFVEKYKINTQSVQCIRTCGWGDDAVLRVEYADFHKDYKPVKMAKQYLWETYGYYPKNLNFNNPHYDRIGCSCLNVNDVSREEFNVYSTLPTVILLWYSEEKKLGVLEFAILNEKQRELSYGGRLFEYFKENS